MYKAEGGILTNRGFVKHWPNDMSSFARFLSVAIGTLILYQSAVVAPAINIALPVEPAAVLLRFIWPIFFALVGGLALVGMVTTRKHRAGLRVNLITTVSMVVCFLLVPVINGAKDADNMTLWKILHMVTVALTFVALILHLIYLFRSHKRA